MKFLPKCSRVIALMCWFWLPASFAHQLSTAYLNLDSDASQQKMQLTLQVRWYDLDQALGLDNNVDGQLTWQEVTSRQAEIFAYLDRNVRLLDTAKGEPCGLLADPSMRTSEHFNEGYGVFAFTVDCQLQTELLIEYSAVFAQNPDHKLLINLVHDSQQYSAVIEHDAQQWRMNFESSGLWQTVSTYVYQGIVHIFIGIDHILFLLALLLTCVLTREDKQWYATAKVKDVIITTAWLVTAFTLAHSVTLTATALEWISPNSRYVEFGIALSVLLTALNNIIPVVTRLGWITFGFGLLHGMGFASVLSELGLDKQHTLVSVVAFNLGVEFGQLAIVLLILPILLWLRHMPLYRTFIMRLGSLGIAGMALNWCIERL